MSSRRRAVGALSQSWGRVALERDAELLGLVAAARRGDPEAWPPLVERFDGCLRGIARSYRLSAADVDDAVQTTWMRLFENLARIKDPAAVAGWLTTTIRRESLRIRQRGVREQLTDEPRFGEDLSCAAPDAAVLERERDHAVHAAMALLPEHHRRLITLLMAQPALDYQRISRFLAIPVGSIGPTRARCLQRLRLNLELEAIADAT